MAGRLYFINVNNVPPEGYFFEAGGERIVGRNYMEFEPRLRALMRKHRIPGLPESVLATFMAPHLADPGRYVRGPAVRAAEVRGPEAFENSVQFLTKPVVPFGKIERRIAACTKCPMHYRGWCPTCTGHIERIRRAFGGARPALPCDAATGVCRCTKAYEAAMCSVEYGADEKIWEGAPDTCWRYNDV